MRRLSVAVALIVSTILSMAQEHDYLVTSEKFREPATALYVSPDQRLILAGFEDGTFRFLDIENLDVLLEVKGAADAAVFDIKMSPAMDVVFLAAGNRIYLYDTIGVRITIWPHHRNTMWSMDIDPSGKYMVSTEVNRTFQLIDIYEGRPVQDMRGHEDITLAVAFSPDGKQIASGSNDKKVFIWDLESRSVTHTFQGLSDDILDVCFSPDGSLVAACSKDQSIRIWNIAKDSLTQLLKGHRDMVLEIAFSPDGNYLLSAGSDQSVRFWDVHSGDQIYAYLENEASVPDIAFLPDGKTFVSACMDGTIAIRSLDPEIFVMKYFREEYEAALKEDPIFLPRKKDEKKADYQARMEQAELKKKELKEFFYTTYMENKK